MHTWCAKFNFIVTMHSAPMKSNLQNWKNLPIFRDNSPFKSCDWEQLQRQTLNQQFRVRYCLQYNNWECCNKTPCPFNHSCSQCRDYHLKSKCKCVKQTNYSQNIQTPIKFLKKNSCNVMKGNINKFTYGFHLGCSFLLRSNISRNHKSALDHPSVIQTYILWRYIFHIEKIDFICFILNISSFFFFF